jgi:hypothetical protein
MFWVNELRVMWEGERQYCGDRVGGWGGWLDIGTTSPIPVNSLFNVTPEISKRFHKDPHFSPAYIPTLGA